MPNAPCLHGGGLRLVAEGPGQIQRDRELDARLFPASPFDPKPARIKVILRVPQDRQPEASAAPAGHEQSAEPKVFGYDRIAQPETDDRQLAHEQLAAAFKTAAQVQPPNPLPAIYTYFGQFIAHELSRMWVPEACLGSVYNLNTSALDLDTLWGNEQFHFDAAAMSLGGVAIGGVGLGAINSPGVPLQRDLPRRNSGEPLTPDCRSDANVALAQVHVALARVYHKLVVLHGETTGRDIMLRMVHDVVINDYLPNIIDTLVYDDVVANGRALVAPGSDAPTDFVVPIEFAAAAFRFGHAMVRATYRWRGFADATQQSLMEQTSVGGGLFPNNATGTRRLDSKWIAQEGDLLDGIGGPMNAASAIVPALSRGLTELKGDFVPGADDVFVNIAERTLARGRQLELPSAQSLWAVVELRRPGTRASGELGEAQILGNDAFTPALLAANKGGPTLGQRTPLWFYVLREAQVCHGGRRLGPLGSRIVMETLHASILAAGGDFGTSDGTSLSSLIAGAELN